MDTMTIDLDALVASVRKHAEERPDFVYEPIGGTGTASGGCFYERAGKPSCIVGHGFFDLGFSADQVALLDEEDMETDQYGTGIGNVLQYRFGIAGDDPRVQWLVSVQGSQDNGFPWGKCVADVDIYYRA